MAEETPAAAAAEQTRSSAGRRDADRLYHPSWLDVVFDWLAGLPGPTWLAYLVLIVPSAILNNSALWLSGLVPAGQLDPAQTIWGAVTVAVLAATHHLRNVAGASFDAFRPALGAGVADPDRVRYEMTVMPARPVVALIVFSVAITPLYYVADPVAAQVVGLSGAGLVARWASEALTSAVFLAILLQSIRQMRRVMRLHEAADRVDPFHPEPLHAFSRLTAQAGIVLILFNTAGILLIMMNTGGLGSSAAVASESFLGLYGPWFAGFIGGAIVIFVVPLLGMHRRLEAEKGRLQGELAERLKSVIAELNRDVDGVELGRADGLNKMLASLLQQRDVLARLPTWPWSTGTIRGFGSALFLPIVLFLVQRYLGQLLG
jgi:hypothetical protein